MPEETAKREVTFEILDDLSQLALCLGIAVQNEKFVLSSDQAVENVLNALPKVLGAVPRTKWIEPPGEFRGDGTLQPPRVVVAQQLIDGLRIQGFNQKVITCAIYRAVELGQLSAGTQVTADIARRPKAKRRMLVGNPKRPGELMARYAGQIPNAYVREVFRSVTMFCVWPTPQMLKRHPNLRQLYKGISSVKRGGGRRDTDLEKDQEIADQWATRKHRNYKALAEARGKNEMYEDIHRALDRDRKRKALRKQGKKPKKR